MILEDVENAPQREIALQRYKRNHDIMAQILSHHKSSNAKDQLKIGQIEKASTSSRIIECQQSMQQLQHKLVLHTLVMHRILSRTKTSC